MAAGDVVPIVSVGDEAARILETGSKGMRDGAIVVVIVARNVDKHGVCGISSSVNGKAALEWVVAEALASIRRQT